MAFSPLKVSEVDLAWLPYFLQSEVGDSGRQKCPYPGTQWWFSTLYDTGSGTAEAFSFGRAVVRVYAQLTC